MTLKVIWSNNSHMTVHFLVLFHQDKRDTTSVALDFSMSFSRNVIPAFFSVHFVGIMPTSALPTCALHIFSFSLT